MIFFRVAFAVIVIALFIIMFYAMLVSASDADDELERQFEKYMKRKSGGDQAGDAIA